MSIFVNEIENPGNMYEYSLVYIVKKSEINVQTENNLVEGYPSLEQN